MKYRKLYHVDKIKRNYYFCHENNMLVRRSKRLKNMKPDENEIYEKNFYLKINNILNRYS